MSSGVKRQMAMIMMLIEASCLEPFVDVAENDVGACGETLLCGKGHVGRDQAAIGGEQQVVDG